MGIERATGDMDLFVNPTKDNHEKLFKVHNEFGMMMGEMENMNNFLDTKKYDVYTFGTSPIQIDIMTECKGIKFMNAYRSSVKFTADNGIEVNVIHYNELIKAKMASNRT